MKTSLKHRIGQIALPVCRLLTGSRARIIMYHRFGEPGVARRLDYHAFEEQLRYLHMHYRPTLLSNIIEALSSGRKLPRNTVALTVDDGYADFLKYAYPLLEKYAIPVTLYVVTDFADQQLWLWFDALQYLINGAHEQAFEISIGKSALHVELSTPKARALAWETIADRCLRLSPTDTLSVIKNVEKAVGISLPEIPTSSYRGLTWNELRRLDSSLVEFGSHTRTHPILSCCTDARLTQEIAESKLILEEQLGRPIHGLCYPNGQAEDYDRRCITLARTAGYRYAVTSYGGLVSKTPDFLSLERLPAGNNFFYFKSALDGLSTLRSYRPKLPLKSIVPF